MVLVCRLGVLAGALAMCSGCDRSAGGPANSRVAMTHENFVQRHHANSPVLLFDRTPGADVDATAFNYRSDWPSTSTRYQSTETVYYSTYVDDHQGSGWYDQDQFYRSARYWQFGSQER